MRGREQMEQGLSRLEEVRDTIRRAEVELRESAYYPHGEARRHLSDAANSLEAAERALRAVLDTLESSRRSSRDETTGILTAEAGRSTSRLDHFDPKDEQR